MAKKTAVSETKSSLFSTRQLRWRTAFTYAIVILFLMLILSVLLATRIEHWQQQQLQAQWTAYGERLLEDLSIREDLLVYGQSQSQTGTTLVDLDSALSLTLKEIAERFGLRLSIFTLDGTLTADSHFDVNAAFGTAVTERLTIADSPTQVITDYDARLRQNALSVTLPVTATPAQLATDEQAPVLGYLRVRVPLPEGGYTAGLLWSTILPLTLMIAAIIIGMMVFQAESSAYTLRRLTAVAEQITKGDLSARTLSLSGGEIGQLARAFNRMADKLQRQITKRAREKDRLRTMLHIMTDGVLLLNRHGSVRVLNDAAANILQTTSERALKRSFVQTVRNHRFVEVLRRCQASGQTETAILELDSGTVIRMIVTPFLQGRDRGHLVVLQDLTRLYQLQTTRQDFISNISHELRTPLASLRALTETLVDGAIDDKVAAHRFLHHMEVEVDALTQMVHELFQLSLIESGQASLELSPTPAVQLIVQGAERLRAQAERAGIDLVIDVPTELPPVCVDAGRVEQVLTNLIHNAVKFTPADGTITVHAHYDATHQAEFVTVQVADTGVGIAHDDLPRIFERFYKADRARSGGGTGLGLAIAKHIVQAHGGTIWAESVPSKGSSFSFTLPLVQQVPTNITS